MAFNFLLEVKNNLEKEFRKYFPKRIANAFLYIDKFKGLSGLEIGGPSFAFTQRGFIPIYKHIKALDGCNFSSDTVWEGKIKSGNTYQFENKVGYQYILDGSALTEIKDEQYDFVLSCHNLEHIANPIKALLEWKRVLKQGGYLLLILPNKLGTFDIKRDYTTFEHILEDYKYNISETDNTHIEEIIRLHDHSRNPIKISIEEFNDLINNNFVSRCAHHHVFNMTLIEEMLNYIDLKVILAQNFSSIHIVVLAKLIN